MDYKVPNVAQALHEKVRNSLQPIAPLDIPTQWGDGVFECSSKVSSFIKCCWSKPIIGGWCAGVRLQFILGEVVYSAVSILLIGVFIIQLVLFSADCQRYFENSGIIQYDPAQTLYISALLL